MTPPTRPVDAPAPSEVVVTVHFASVDGEVRLSATGPLGVMEKPGTVARIRATMEAYSGGASAPEVLGAAGVVADYALRHWIEKAPTCRRLVVRLSTADQPLTGGMIAKEFGTHQAVLHKSLGALCDRDVFVRTQHGPNVFYSFNEQYRAFAESLGPVDVKEPAESDAPAGHTLTIEEQENLTWIKSAGARRAVVAHLITQVPRTASWLAVATKFHPSTVREALEGMKGRGIVDGNVPVADEHRRYPGSAEIFFRLSDGFRPAALSLNAVDDSGLRASGPPAISDAQVVAMRGVFGNPARKSIMDCLASSSEGEMNLTLLKVCCQVQPDSTAARKFAADLAWLQTNELLTSQRFGNGYRWSIRPEVVPYLNGAPAPEPEIVGPVPQLTEREYACGVVLGRAGVLAGPAIDRATGLSTYVRKATMGKLADYGLCTPKYGRGYAAEGPQAALLQAALRAYDQSREGAPCL